jgi:hypothetical protein
MKVLQFVCGHRSMPWLRLYSLLAAACENGETVYVCVGPVSGVVLSTRRARRTAPSNRKDPWFEC